MKNYFILSLALLLLTACGPTPTPHVIYLTLPASATPPQPTATITPTPTRTTTPTPSATATQPTATPSATPTPYPTLIPQGPYLLYTTNYKNNPLWLVNAGGQGRKEIVLPESAYIPNLQKAVSPDGKWLAFYTGTTDAPYDLTLNLLSLPEGTIRPVTKVLSPAYPDNLAPIADYYTQQTQQPDLTFGVETIKQHFQYDILVFDWSPDGRFLAFAGQMDGPSSDVYRYELSTKQITRMTNDLPILSGISWSPTGKWLLIYNALISINYSGATLHRLRANETDIQNPPALERGFWWKSEGWMTPDFYLLSGSPDGGDLYGLRYLNVETGQFTDLWPEIYFDYAVDADNQQVVVGGAPTHNSDEFTEYGTYLVSFTGQRKKISEEISWGVDFRGGLTTRFIGQTGEHDLAITSEGLVITMTQGVSGSILVSPNKQWFVAYGLSGAIPISLYSFDDQLVRTLNGIQARHVLWRTDSTGFFATDYKTLYAVTVPDGALLTIDQCPPDVTRCEFNARSMVWVP